MAGMETPAGISNRVGLKGDEPKEIGRYRPTGVYQQQQSERRRLKKVVIAVVVAALVGLSLWVAYRQTRGPNEQEQEVRAGPPVDCFNSLTMSLLEMTVQPQRSGIII